MTEEGTGQEEEAGRVENEQVGETTDNTNQTRISQKSSMEKQVMYVPSNHLGCLLLTGLYFVSLDLPVLLISIFPTESRNLFTISLCLAWDTCILSVLCAWETYAMYAMFSFVLTFNDTVDLVMKKITNR